MGKRLDYRAEGLKVSFEIPDELIIPTPVPTLASLWNKTEAVMFVPESGRGGQNNFVELKMRGSERPISMVDGSGWLAYVHDEKNGFWNVGVWESGLKMRFAEEENVKAAKEIEGFARSLVPCTWGWLISRHQQQPDNPHL